MREKEENSFHYYVTRSTTGTTDFLMFVTVYGKDGKGGKRVVEEQHCSYSVKARIVRTLAFVYKLHCSDIYAHHIKFP